MSTNDIAEARALVEALERAGAAARAAPNDYTSQAEYERAEDELAVKAYWIVRSLLDRLDTLAPLEAAAARVRETSAECLDAQAVYDAADAKYRAVEYVASGGDAISASHAARTRADARRSAAHRAAVDANDALLALARGGR